MNGGLVVVPLRLADAAEFVKDHHRHHRPPQGHKFSLGVVQDQVLHGVAIVGRPVARHCDDGRTLEVTRTATDGTRNANSILYGAARRATFALGYDRLITYTQAGESGASLRGAGYQVVAQRKPRSGWWTPSRPRGERNAYIQRTLWETTP
ncbi:XF1762 family protein [Nesterenkonia sp. K-15-9-6]|uniref:XF1762 family protein n=1 Tax=Nesterenkonia sp. K-15-9-6 TaxID=3093918 RepID=UPI0040448D1C